MNLNCPNCHYQLTRIQLDKVEVDHCNNCGGTLFDYNEVNRITLSDAEKLSLMRQTNDISGEEKFSPRDGSILKRITHESVPQHVTLLKSDTTQEVFAFAEDLINFKKAQDAKLAYMKTWHIPLPALSTVLVFGFVVAISATTVLFSSLLSKPGSQAIQASQQCRNGLQVFSSSEDASAAYGVTCETESNMTCRVEAFCLGKTQTFTFTNTPTRTHAGFVPATCSRIKMICSDNNLTIETDEQPLE